MRRVSVVLSVALALVLASAAGAGTVRLGWKESARAGGRVAVLFRVEQLVTKGSTWRVTVSFTNRTRTTIRITPAFGLAVYPTRKIGKPTAVLAATFYRPRLPARLGPGRTWRGTFGGRGSPDATKWVRVVFGAYESNLPTPLGPQFFWITDHAWHVSPLAA